MTYTQKDADEDRYQEWESSQSNYWKANIISLVVFITLSLGAMFIFSRPINDRNYMESNSELNGVQRTDIDEMDEVLR